MRAKADDPNPTAAHAVTRTLESAHAICYKQGFLFFAGEDQDGSTPVGGSTEHESQITGQEEEDDETAEVEDEDEDEDTGADVSENTAT